MLGAVPRALYVWGALGTLGLILAVSMFHVYKLGAGGPGAAKRCGSAGSQGPCSAKASPRARWIHVSFA